MFQSTYSILTRLSWPFLRLLPYVRAQKGKEVNGRIQERFGKSTAPKKSGKLIWIHAASNGETLSALPLINHLTQLPSSPKILFTTMTVTAAELVKKRTNPEEVIHQFIPYDHPRWIKRFHDTWSPDLVLWIESELWPNHLKTLKERGIPAVLLNARLSNKSVNRWSVVKEVFQSLLSCFDQILAQTERDKSNLEQLGIKNVSVKGNLKDLSLPLPYDEFALQDIKNCIGNRPVILFASTHAPEEETARNVYKRLKAEHPDLLTIIVPRHPKRGEDLASELNVNGTSVALRSLKMSPRKDTNIYIADTLGELGLFYELSPIAFIGNSLGTKPGGGHNLLEPAWFQCAIVSGDDLHNFSVQADEMPKLDACKIVNNSDELYATLKALLKDEESRTYLAKNAYDYVRGKQSAGMDKIVAAIEPSCKSAELL